MSRPIITILRCDDVPEPDRSRHGDTHERVARHIQNVADTMGWSIDIRHIDVYGGQLPADDDPSALFVTTGSAAEPFSDEPWVINLRNWCVDAIAADRCIYAICFGHQVIAEALGGRTGRAGSGWEVGCVAMEQLFGLPPADTNAATTADTSDTTVDGEVRLLMSHRDEVLELPRGASHWLRGEQCRYQGYVIEQRVVAVQGHPEFDTAQVSDLYERRRKVLGETMTDAALSSAKRANDGLALTEQVLRYFLNG
jgi:GMP synthase-like glutamine amidotransferase